MNQNQRRLVVIVLVLLALISLYIGIEVRTVRVVGVGIAAPLLDRKPPLLLWGGLACLAGLPAVLGLWLGAFAYAAHWAALALAIGAGAILQVIMGVSGLVYRRARPEDARGLFAVSAGLVAGVGLMYLTALLVTA